MQFREDGLRVPLDGQPAIIYRTDYANASRGTHLKIPDPAMLGISGWNGPMIVHRIAVTEVTGPRPIDAARGGDGRSEE